MTRCRWPLWLAAVGLVICVAGIVRSTASRAAEPERTATRWQVWQQLPGRDWEARGKALAGPTACNLDLAGVTYVVPSGTLLVCRRIERAATR